MSPAATHAKASPYDAARAVGLVLYRFDSTPGGRRYQLHNGASVAAVIEESPRGFSSYISPAHLATDAPVILRHHIGGWAYTGRSATLAGAVSMALRGCGR